MRHAGATLVKVVPYTALEAAAKVGVGFSPVADAFGQNESIDPAHPLAGPDGDLRLRAVSSAIRPLEAETAKSG